MDSDQEYYTDDSLLHYCEDYAWDPSDCDIENGDHNTGNNWDDSETAELLPISSTQSYTATIYTPPQQPSKVSPQLLDDTTLVSLGEMICRVSRVELDTRIFHVEETMCNREGNNYSSHRFGALIHTFLLRICSVIKKALRFEILNKKWVFFKWLFVVLNVVIEVCQAMFSQENAQGNISTSFYIKMSIITSAFCVIISLIEMIYEGKKANVAWRNRGYLGWFYYPGRQRKLFGRFSLIFGVVSSMIQFFINLVELVINKNFLKFDTLPLLLSSGYLVAALVDRGEKDMIKCEVHGRCYECSRRKVDLENELFGYVLDQVDSSDESFEMF